MATPGPVGLALDLVEAKLREANGNIKAAARALGVTRGAVQYHVRQHPHLQEIVNDARQGRVDDAEDSLGKAVDNGEAWAVCFTLKTVGKDRGYVERFEHEDVGEDIDRAIDEEVERLDPRRQEAAPGPSPPGGPLGPVPGAADPGTGQQGG